MRYNWGFRGFDLGAENCAGGLELLLDACYSMVGESPKVHEGPRSSSPMPHPSTDFDQKVELNPIHHPMGLKVSN